MLKKTMVMAVAGLGLAASLASAQTPNTAAPVPGGSAQTATRHAKRSGVKQRRQRLKKKARKARRALKNRLKPRA